MAVVFQKMFEVFFQGEVDVDIPLVRAARHGHSG
jgi:hypothetical protein